ncbi:MAG: DUF4832 domain-containing protein [Paludibacteraceae bacterium]|nr:DUF4832 domain-containing protein [Paludibacteraceae bacterium]
MRTRLLSVLLGLVALSTNVTAVNYTADNSTIFRNPERGFTEEISGKVSKSSNHLLVGNESFFDEGGVRPTESLAVVLYNLSNYRTKDKLDQEILNGFDDDMQVLRNKGFKCVLRFAYSESDKKDATKARVLKHIAQLKPYLKKNADVIYVLQAGFVGEWGEWYYSENFGNETQHLNSNRRAVLEALLDACPQDRFLLVRYPMIKAEYLNTTSPMGSSIAFDGSARARIGHHNDAFLNTYGNDGTYVSWDESDDDDQSVRDYIAQETLYVPNGGETNVESSSTAKKVYKNAEAEMAAYHWSFCGESYSETVTNKWKSDGIFDKLNRNMGYRYQLISGNYSTSANPGGKMSVNISLKNVGYAPLYNYRVAKIVLKNGSKTYSIDLASDPRRWTPGNTISINEQLDVPADIPAGTYQLYLHMPDAYASLADKPAFAIRFANKDVWDANTGMNNLNASITISGGSTPAPTPALSVSASSVSFGEINVGASATRSFTVTGSNLSGNVTISSNNSALSVSPASISKSSAQSGATVTLTLVPAAAGSGSAKVTIASSGASSKTVNVSWTGKQVGGGEDPQPIVEGIELPATLNKANVSAYSSDMTWYNSNYFDFGPTDAPNLDRWAEWAINVPSAAKYKVSITGYYTNGHQWQLELVEANKTYSMPSSWSTGNKTENGSSSWSLPAGNYTLRVKNIMEWSQPKLQSIKLTKSSSKKPQAIDEVEAQQLDMDAPMYDILGRRVNASYKGIVIQNGQKYLLK